MTPNQLPPPEPVDDREVFEALVTALAGLPLNTRTDDGGRYVIPSIQAGWELFIRAIESATLAALVQQAQEPVAWISQKDLDRLKVATVVRPLVSIFKPLNDGEVPLYTTPQPQPAPLAGEVMDALLELVESHEAPYPSEASGMEAQDAWATRRTDALEKARAILALRPQAVPMTPEQRDAAIDAKLTEYD